MCGLFDRLDIAFTDNRFSVAFFPMTKIKCLMCIAHIYLSVRDELIFLKCWHTLYIQTC